MAGSNNTRFGITAKYKLDCRTSLSAKVNNASPIGPGYTQTLRPGVQTDPVSFNQWKELQCRRSQGWLGL